MRDLVVVVALALVALAFWKFRILDPGAELAAMGPPWKLGLGYGDMFVQVYPQWQRVIRSIQAGDLPRSCAQ